MDNNLLIEYSSGEVVCLSEDSKSSSGASSGTPSFGAENDRGSPSEPESDSDLDIVSEIELIESESEDEDSESVSSDESSDAQPEVRECDVITISDDEQEPQPRKAPELLLCLRCASKKDGSFTDESKYWTHVDRHVIDDHFSCVTCNRPYIKLTHCLSHEYRVHGTPIPRGFYDRDIAFAKKYIKSLEEARKEPGTSEHARMLEDMDPEDLEFYGNRFHCSGTYYPYRGPTVNNMTECYEMQVYSKRAKFSHLTSTANYALKKHRNAVQAGVIDYKLGRFGGPKTYMGFPGPAAPVRVQKAATSRSCGTSTTAPSKKRLRDAAVSESDAGEKDKPQKRVRYISFSSDDEEDNIDDADYVPEKETKKTKQRNHSGIKRKHDEEPVMPGPSKKAKSSFNEPGPSQQLLGSVPGTSGRTTAKEPVKGQVKKVTKSKGKPTTDQPKKSTKKNSGKSDKEQVVPTKQVFSSALLDRKCLKCDFTWSDDNDLRKHRDECHPSMKVIDLITKAVPLSYKETTEINVREVRKPSATQKKGKNQSGETSAAKKSKATTAKKAPKKKNGRKGRSLIIQARSPVPLPNSTFSKKEEFLHNLELVNPIRLHLYQKRPVEHLNLRPCHVPLERLSESDIEAHRAALRLNSFMPTHFLLG